MVQASHGESEFKSFLLKDDGVFPNNGKLPLLVLTGAIDLSGKDPAASVERLFAANGWVNSWRNGIYPFQHYHSTAHEVLGVYAGWVKARLGGPGGVTIIAEPGDVIVIPAGVAHKNLDQSQGFRVVGAYPRGQMWDMNYGKPGERPAADKQIKKVPLPVTDPVYGKNGPLLEIWQ
jgi:uncharacterized protein YjlB